MWRAAQRWIVKVREAHHHAFRVHDRDLHMLAEVLHKRVHRGYGRDHRRLVEVPHVRVHRGHGRDHHMLAEELHERVFRAHGRVHRRLVGALHEPQVRVFRGHARGRGIPLVGAGCEHNGDHGCVRPLRGGCTSAG